MTDSNPQRSHLEQRFGISYELLTLISESAEEQNDFSLISFTPAIPGANSSTNLSWMVSIYDSARSRPRTVAFLGWVEKSQSKDVWSYRMFGAAVASPHIYGPKEKAAIGLLNHILSLMEGNS